MKALTNYLILFDAECPICTFSAQAVVRKGILDDSTSYQEIPDQQCSIIDRQRAANQIALINKETGEVRYGAQAVLKILAVVVPVLKPLFEFRPFVWVMSGAYKFISLNRRVIIPVNSAAKFNIQPQLGIGMRLGYLLFAWIVTAFILSHYTPLMNGLLPEGHKYREYLICGGQIFFQGLIISMVSRNKTWDYLGNMMTISLGGALLLIPVLLIAQWIDLNPLCYAAWFMTVAGLMLLEHIRRSKLLQIGWVLTISWVLYRVLVLLFILLTRAI